MLAGGSGGPARDWAAVVLCQFVPRFTLGPRPAARRADILLFALAGVVALSATLALAGRAESARSWLGIGVTVAVLDGMPVLSRAKRRPARRLNSSALAADAVQSATCAYLVAATLL